MEEAGGGTVREAGPGPREPAILLGLAAALLVYLAFDLGPASDTFTFSMEVFPVVLGVPLLVATRRRFPLTPLAYRLLFLHAVVLMVGGHYTYADVPLGNWARDHLGFQRNPYDRLGHLLQGFVPALLAREILLRTSPLRGRWLPVLVVCACMAISAGYEFVEWWTALAVGQDADKFLGTQGDPWDTQWDMFLATCGAILSLLTLSRVHDRQLERLGAAPPSPARDTISATLEARP
jgi:putative membrane protein